MNPLMLLGAGVGLLLFVHTAKARRNPWRSYPGPKPEHALFGRHVGRFWIGGDPPAEVVEARAARHRHHKRETLPDQVHNVLESHEWSPAERRALPSIEDKVVHYLAEGEGTPYTARIAEKVVKPKLHTAEANKTLEAAAAAEKGLPEVERVYTSFRGPELSWAGVYLRSRGVRQVATGQVRRGGQFGKSYVYVEKGQQARARELLKQYRKELNAHGLMHGTEWVRGEPEVPWRDTPAGRAALKRREKIAPRDEASEHVYDKIRAERERVAKLGLAEAPMRLGREYGVGSGGNRFREVYYRKTGESGERRIDVKVRDGLHGSLETRANEIRHMALDMLLAGKEGLPFHGYGKRPTTADYA